MQKVHIAKKQEEYPGHWPQVWLNDAVAMLRKGNSLVVQWLVHAFTAEDAGGFDPGQGTEILQAA